MKIDLVVVTYKPDNDFLEMIQKITSQTVSLNRIIIYNTEQKFFDRLAYSARFASDYKNSEVHHISRREFDNGKTRNLAVKCSDADYFLVIAQNAIPVNDELIANLVKALEQNDKIAAAYARQIEAEGSKEYSKYMLKYFFPEDSAVRSADDLDTYKSMTYQLSNVCALYRRDIFDELDGFVNHAIMNEDVLYAAKAINAGYKIAYAANAVVSYSYALGREKVRKMCFDSAVSYVKHPEVFDMNVIIASARKLMQKTKTHLSKHGHSRENLEFMLESRAILKGFKQGRRYKSMSRKRILKLTGNPGYWSVDELMRERSGVNARLGYGRSEEELKMLSKPPVSSTDNDNGTVN